MISKTYFSVETISGILVLVVASQKGISKVVFNPSEDSLDLSNSTKLQSNDPYLFGIFDQLKEYFAGTRKEFDVTLDIEGTDFQKRVWNELRNIPYGKTISYKTLSEKLGDVKAIRAVGKANGQNPIAIIIPCHRVIGANGNLVGYAGGLDIKEKLLHIEGTDFQKRVWNELRKIPFGKTISYKILSEKLGDVKAIRAVGKANGQNPIAIIIPCHRVIGANGSLVGYAGGLAIKEKLLHLEGALNPELFD